MNHKTTILLIGMWGWILGNQSLSQITVTQSQIQQIFSPGSFVRFFIDSTSQTVNIGNTGGPNIYDFSKLPFYFAQRDTNFSVSQIPQLTARYPLNTAALKTPTGSGGSQYLLFAFPSQQLVQPGIATITPPSTRGTVHKDSPEIQFEFPLTLNSQWTQTFGDADTTYVNGTVTKLNPVSESWTNLVDGYGTLLLPGLSLNCLRLRKAQTSFSGKDFNFVTQEGALLIINSDTSQADTGIIQANGIQYLLGGALSLVKETGVFPMKFSVSQNYPNPFNPSTTIRFSLVKSNHVKLTIYTLLGQEIETIVNEKLSAGEFEVKWNADSQPSGVYLYRIQVGDFFETKKIVLLK